MSNTGEAYVEKMKAILDNLNAEIDKLETKTRRIQAVTQQQIGEQIETLEKKRKATGENLEKLRQAGEGAWEDLQAGVENAIGALGEAVRYAQSSFK